MTDESLASVIKTQNLIFDVDGNLIDSERDIANAQLYVFRQFGMHQYTSEELYPHIGKTNAEIHRFFLPSEFHDRFPEAYELFVA
jgi:phosphoglycolate phosphatase-like HAD superfamily hydrolase